MILIVRDKKYTVNLILDLLKKPGQLPVEIPTSKCPNRDTKCKLRHGEYVISKYDIKLDRFLIRSFPVHRDVSLEAWFPTAKVNDMFINCLKKKKFTVPELQKIVNLTHTFRKKVMSLRFTEMEWKKIQRKAKVENLPIYDYARSKILDQSNSND
jgi:hypothetical protein